MKALRTLALLGAAAFVPVVLQAPRPDPAPGRPGTVDAIVAALEARRTHEGLSGQALADAAIKAVNEAYTHYSAWHLWETPSRSLRHGRGRSIQFNSVLAQVLIRLGFTVRVVHAARVRREARPWWAFGHTWVQVEVDGLWRDADAESPSGVGQINFVPLTPVRDVSPLTAIDTALGLVPFVTAQVWRQWLMHEPTPGWLYRPFAEHPGREADAAD